MASITREQVLMDIVKVLNETHSMLGSSDTEIVEDTYLAEDLGVDSLRLVTIMSNLEDIYGIDFSVEDTDPRHFHQISDLLKVILDTLEGAAGQ
jgi:acyl carrier protein